MNKKAQVELSPGIVLLGIIGAVLGYFVSKSMHPGAFWIIVSTLGCGATGIIVGNIASNN